MIKSRKKIKLLVVAHNSFEKSIGGIERYMNTILNSKRDGVDLSLLLPCNGKPKKLKRNGINVYRTRYLNEDEKRDINADSTEFFKYLSKLIDKTKPDLVLAENLNVGISPAYTLKTHMACFNKKVPLVLHMHSYPKTPIQKETVKHLPWSSIVCISKSLAHHLYDMGVKIGNMSTTYLGCDVKSFRPGLDRGWLRRKTRLCEDDFVILHASRIVIGKVDLLKEKGIINLLNAFSLLAPRHENMRLVIACAKPPRRLMKSFKNTIEKINELADLYGVGDKVRTVSFELDDMPLAYNGADLYVMASETETFGQVYVEAMACGVPVIGTRVGGVSEIVESGKSGYLIHPNDHIELAKRIEIMSLNTELRDKFIKNGLSTVKNKFHSDKQFNRLMHRLAAVKTRS